MAAVVLLAVLAATRARRRENNARLARAGRAAASGPAGSGGFSSEVDLLQRQHGTEAQKNGEIAPNPLVDFQRKSGL